MIQKLPPDLGENRTPHTALKQCHIKGLFEPSIWHRWSAAFFQRACRTAERPLLRCRKEGAHLVPIKGHRLPVHTRTYS